jgi:leader peptidase (prepilin peptidase)/N-methyltransferase
MVGLEIPPLFLLVAFAFGAAVGSFLNVCIYRMPAGQSVVWPASRCPRCNTPIRPYDNLPLLSYVILRGRCRACAAPIPARYVIVEGLAGLSALAALWHWGSSPEALVAFGFLSALIVVTFIDLDHQIIPDVISLPGIAVGLLLSLVLEQPGLRSAAIGAALGGAVLAAVAYGYYWLTGREGMGGGDVKLLAMIGAFLGWKAVPVTLLLASLTGSIIGVSLMLLRGASTRLAIPFGPFLAAGAVCALFFGDALVDWYLGLAGF